MVKFLSAIDFSICQNVLCFAIELQPKTLSTLYSNVSIQNDIYEFSSLTTPKAEKAEYTT